MSQSKLPALILPIDPHSCAGGSPTRVRHLQLELAVDFTSHTLSGIATWQLVNPESATEIFFDVRDLTVEAVVTLDAAGAASETRYHLGPVHAVLGQALQVALPYGTAAVRITYRTSPTAAALQWLAPDQTAGTEPFLFTQSQAILARTWVPCQDSPGIRFTYEATVRVPAHLLALMSAENPQHLNSTGEYRFRMAQPIPSYLLALAVGDLAFAPLSHRTGVYAEPATLPGATAEFGDLEQMVKAAEQLYGPYRWERYDLLVLPPYLPFRRHGKP